MPHHNFSLWHVKPEDGRALWVKCSCGRWEGWARTYEDISVLCGEHREDAQYAEDLESETAS